MADNLSVNPKTAFSSEDEGIDFPTKARHLVFEAVERIVPETDIYIVWFAYTLGVWKAVVSTALPDGRYYEVTYNKDKSEYYVDVYQKIDQKKFTKV